MLQSNLVKDGASRVYRNRWCDSYEFLNFLRHEKVYELARSHCRNKTVLDYGCGSGYGTEILAREASHVVGVDASRVAIEYCISTCTASNVEFMQVKQDYTLHCGDNAFDVVTSFQVVEHMRDVERYLRLLWRVLKEEGTLFLSTPNRSWRLFPFQKPWNREHYREYSVWRLKAELRRVFPSAKILGVHGQRDYDTMIRAHGNRARLRAYARNPIWALPGKILPHQERGRRSRAAQAITLTNEGDCIDEIPGHFATDDILIDTHLGKALDFLVVARKTCGKS